ncbi:flagellar basal-body rod protein FlgG [Reinekea marinisedimentorum]|uniref:Flagellar basal-body rod protein FlgG n=1 Tax=Reinekea marinisedimentorum TaxID=230495 RepID=A0A4R3I2A4_9GAMM|nr:flagellar basal-body rod protein FlgG [Reinekea marinisedimentorum]TCS39916.1 flagellar basal-body rod protein FlgG [Reinekea marinisedimentorum]
MMKALWVGKTGLEAQDTSLSAISNNMANASTTAFKKDRAVFEDLIYQVQRQPGGQSSQSTQLPSGLQLGCGTRVVATQKQFTQGDIEVTGETLDLAINGRGMFQITMPDGDLAYTRDGSFQIDSEGNLVTSSGYLLEPNIVVPDQADTITIGTDGIVTAVYEGETTGEEIGTIEIADFINYAGLEAIGNNLFQETDASGEAVIGDPSYDGFGSLEQGALEASNISIVEEMVDLIATQRAYEMNSKVVSTADSMLGFITSNL